MSADSELRYGCTKHDHVWTGRAMSCECGALLISIGADGTRRVSLVGISVQNIIDDLDQHRRAILVLGLTGFLIQLAYGGFGAPAATAQQLHRDVPIILELFNLLGGDENQLDPELVAAVRKSLEVEAVAEHQAETS